MGDKNNENNTISWHTVRLNPTSREYYVLSDLSVSKVRNYGDVASKVFIYVDDVRSLRWCNKEC